MGSTNKTANVVLSQFVDADKPTWRGDYNVDMGKIDAAIHSQVTSIANANQAGVTAQTLATNAQNTANTAVTNAGVANTNASSAVTTANNAAAAAASVATNLTAGLGLRYTKVESDGRYQTLTAAEAFQSQAASIEDLFTNTLYTATGATISGLTSGPLFVAPFNMALTNLALVEWSAVGVDASDTNYWSAILKILSTDNVTYRTVATKTTKVTGGQAISNRKNWTFDTSAFVNQNVAPGEIVVLTFSPTGTPAAITGPVMVTTGYRPL